MIKSAALLRTPSSLTVISADYLIAALPIVLWACRFSGPRALCMVLLGILFSLIWEGGIEYLLHKKITVWNGTAALEGMMFSLLLPANAPYFAVIIGTLFSSVCFKALFAGIQRCPIHPTIGAYALLSLFFSKTFDTLGAFGEHFAVFGAAPSGSVALSPLSHLASGGIPDQSSVSAAFQGRLPGNMGELSLLLLIVAAVYLFLRKHISLIPTVVAVFTVFLLSLILPLLPVPSDALTLRYAFLHAFSGSLIFLTVFPASFPTHAPYLRKMQFVYGLGIGLLTFLIRYLGIADDGAVFAVLIMQLILPLIKRFFTPRHYAKT